MRNLQSCVVSRGAPVRDEYAAAWKVRKILAAIQLRHLIILGVYLQNCRHDMESRGPELDRRAKTSREDTAEVEESQGRHASRCSLTDCTVGLDDRIPLIR